MKSITVYFLFAVLSSGLATSSSSGIATSNSSNLPTSNSTECSNTVLFTWTENRLDCIPNCTASESNVEVLRYECDPVAFLPIQLEISTNEKNISERYPHLRTLDISNLDIYGVYSYESQEAGVYDKIIHLNASHNQFNRISRIFFDSMPKLAEIDFSYNDIPGLSASILNGGTTLRVINLSHNQIGHIENHILSQFELLERLDLSNNRIKSLNPNIFEHNLHLTFLNLQHNPLTKFDFNIFPSVFPHSITVLLPSESLTHLDVRCRNSHCLFKKFEDDNFAKEFLNLEYLNVEGNNYTRIHHITPQNFPKLHFLGISKNRFHCEDLKEFLDKWKAKPIHFINNSTTSADNINGIECHRNGASLAEMEMELKENSSENVTEVVYNDVNQNITLNNLEHTLSAKVQNMNTTIIITIVVVCIVVLVISIILSIVCFVRLSHNLSQKPTKIFQMHQIVQKTIKKTLTQENDEPAFDDLHDKLIKTNEFYTLTESENITSLNNNNNVIGRADLDQDELQYISEQQIELKTLAENKRNAAIQ